MRIEEAIKKKQAPTKVKGGDAFSSAHEKTTFSLRELKIAVRESIINQYSADQKILVNPEKLRQLVWRIIEEEREAKFNHIILDAEEKQLLVENIIQQLTGFGVIDPLIKNEEITEIMINGINKIFVEKKGKIEKALSEQSIPLKFETENELLHLIEKIVAPINRKVDESDPIVDARLPDGSRVNVVIRPISLDGPIVTIRKFPENPYNMKQLVELGALEQEIANWLENLVAARYNIVVSGGTGSGKTTFLNALSMFIPSSERIITVEDSAELKVPHISNLVRLETRTANVEGKGAIQIRDLVRTALRMRPDRIIVGEVRGGEALDMLQAMNTGHDGSLTTGHANAARDMLSRLETMVLMSGLDLPLPAIRQQIASSVELIIQLGRLSDGSRKVLQISEVRDYKNGEMECVDILRWKTKTVTDSGEVIGFLEPTGEMLQQTEKWKSRRLPESHFQPSEFLSKVKK